MCNKLDVQFFVYSALKSFGIKDYVKMLGFISDSAQDTALRGKYLRRLIEIVNPFTEGALRTLMDSYISKIGIG